MIITELLAVLSISAAAGLRLALPLLLIGFISGNLWAQVPLLSQFPPTVVVGVLVSWTLVELVFSKGTLVQRLFQSTELALSPLVGAIAGITVARTLGMSDWLPFLLGGLGGVLALLFHLVQVGWLYRFRRPPIGLIVAGDVLCVYLVLSAFDAPRQGGLVALLLLWLALRTSSRWRRWYEAQAAASHRQHPRKSKHDPD